MKRIDNASQLPKVYFGLHMASGLATYPDLEGQPTFLIEEPALKKMDPTYQGKPVYVHHVDEVDLKQLEGEIAGVVVRSFLNELDGKHWVEFTVQSDAGHLAIAQGWALSNSYNPTEMTGPGTYHAIDYTNEILDGEYEHLALTPTPRYKESKILTPEEYKQYCESLRSQIETLKNSQQGAEPMLKIFSMLTNSDAKEVEKLMNTVVELPKTKKQVQISKLVNDEDEREEKEEKGETMANDEHMVKLNDDDDDKNKNALINVGKLKSMYNDAMKEMGALKSKYDEAEEKFGPFNDDDVAHNDDEDPDHEKEEKAKLKELEEMHNSIGAEIAAKKKGGKVVNAEVLAKARETKEKIEALKNAESKALEAEAAKITNGEGTTQIKTSSDRAADGRKSYGSGS